MPHFQLEKGGKFQLDKGIQRVKVAMGWDAGDNFDLDASAFGLVHLNGGKPTFYNDGSHAVFYGNTSIKQPDGKFATPDGSIIHSGDNRTGAGDGDDEVINVDFGKVPSDIAEIAIWVTIYKAHDRHQNFGLVQNSYIKLTDVDANSVMCEYKLREGYGDALAVQVGSFTHDPSSSQWTFTAVGAGAAVEINQIVEQYS